MLASWISNYQATYLSSAHLLEQTLQFNSNALAEGFHSLQSHAASNFDLFSISPILLVPCKSRDEAAKASILQSGLGIGLQLTLLIRNQWRQMGQEKKCSFLWRLQTRRKIAFLRASKMKVCRLSVSGKPEGWSWVKRKVTKMFLQ